MRRVDDACAPPVPRYVPPAATDQVVVEWAGGGQSRLAVSGVRRHPYPTGVQVTCASCARHGVDRLGLPYREPGDPTPLCVPCWRGARQRQAAAQRRELGRLLWEGIGDAEAAATCAACGEPEPSADCWLCGYAWLQQMRERFAADQAEARAAAAAEAEDRAAQAEAVAEAEARVAELTGWVGRLGDVVDGYARGNGYGRAVELTADLLARLDAARTSGRGRPDVTGRVGAVLAVDSDWRTGARALPGRARSAELAGCSDRAVYNAWHRAVDVGWAVRTRVGGRNSLARRLQVGRANDRAEFDLRPLHRSRVDAAARARHLPAALTLLGELLTHAEDLLGRAREDLDTARARTGTDVAEQGRRLRLAHAVDRGLQRVITPTAAALLAANTCRPHPVSQGECDSSCSYWGLRYSPPIMIHYDGCPGEPACGRWNIGASRSPTRKSPGDLGGCGSRPARRGRARPAGWAWRLARQLASRWSWLAAAPSVWVAATLGARLGPEWTAGMLTGYVIGHRGGRAPLEDPDAPVAYLRALLDAALGEARTEPPAPARAVTDARRRAAAAEAAAARERTAARRAEHVARAAAAVAGHTVADVVALRARLPHRPGDPAGSRLEGCDWPQVRQPGSGLPARPPDPA